MLLFGPAAPRTRLTNTSGQLQDILLTGVVMVVSFEYTQLAIAMMLIHDALVLCIDNCIPNFPFESNVTLGNVRPLVII